jgi:hypothetical protein
MTKYYLVKDFGTYSLQYGTVTHVLPFVQYITHHPGLTKETVLNIFQVVNSQGHIVAKS